MKELTDVGIEVLANEPLGKHTTWGIGGPAEWYLEIHTVPQLKKTLELAKAKHIPIFFLGNGSNVLVGDRGILGFVARLKGDFETIEISGRQARAGSGALLPALVTQAAEKGLGGIEPLAGVPGSVGGALVMNAGTRDLEIGDVLDFVEVLDQSGNEKRILKNQIQFNYRSSSLIDVIITRATFNLKPGIRDEIMKSVRGFMQKRLESQPIGTANAGSVFKNPEGSHAAVLIEKCGLKGLRRGKAEVSTKHANFIVNHGGATADDIRGLILEIQEKVMKQFGVMLESEVKFVGR